jgi:NADH dehydrogenase
MQTTHTDILILGAGIGGYETFRSLAHRLRKAGLNKKITIVDQHNYFTFVPLMHEVAVGAVEPQHATLSLAQLVAGTPHRFMKGRIKKIDPEKRHVELECFDNRCTNLTYDYCVMSLGSTINYFGVPGAKERTYHVRTLENALTFRRALINRYDTSDQHITISVVGGGPTGVEVVGQIAHLVNRDLAKFYPAKTRQVRIIERGAELASILPPKARVLVTKRLQKLGVEVLTGTGVKEVQDDALLLSDGRKIESDLTLWAAGMLNAADQLLPAEYCDRGRVIVNNHFESIKNKTLFAIGDNAFMVEPVKDQLPQLGEAAHSAGKYVARYIAAQYRGHTLPPFAFHSKGTLMPIGERYGLLVRGNIVLHGFIMWWVRRTVYVWFMPGFVHKLKIVMDWTLRLFGSLDIISLNMSAAPQDSGQVDRTKS